MENFETLVQAATMAIQHNNDVIDPEAKNYMPRVAELFELTPDDLLYPAHISSSKLKGHVMIVSAPQLRYLFSAIPKSMRAAYMMKNFTYPLFADMPEYPVIIRNPYVQETIASLSSPNMRKKARVFSITIITEGFVDFSGPEDQWQCAIFFKTDEIECHTCKQKLERSKKCGRCLAVRYCSVECQSKDWSAHKKVCKAPPKQ